jgi:hypothetical protein
MSNQNIYKIVVILTSRDRLTTETRHIWSDQVADYMGTIWQPQGWTIDNIKRLDW